jgi:hypothetical protein
LHHRDTSNHILESALVPGSGFEQHGECKPTKGIKQFLENVDTKMHQYKKTSKDPDIAMAQSTEEAPAKIAGDVLHDGIDGASASFHTVPPSARSIHSSCDLDQRGVSKFQPLTHGVRETMCASLGLGSFSMPVIHACLGRNKLALKDSQPTMAIERNRSEELTSK